MEQTVLIYFAESRRHFASWCPANTPKVFKVLRTCTVIFKFKLKKVPRLPGKIPE